MKFEYNDGGRSNYYKGTAGDCVTRAVAIATGRDYKTVYKALHKEMKRQGDRGSPRSGVHRSVYQKYLESIGWQWVPTMKVGQGCKVHLVADELPGGNIICRLSKHVVAVIDGVVHDTYRDDRDGTRCVYGYFQETRREK
jgi:hypothetical protein